MTDTTHHCPECERLATENTGLRSVIRAAGCTCNDYAAISPHACDCPLPELALDAAEWSGRLLNAARVTDELRAERDELRDRCERFSRWDVMKELERMRPIVEAACAYMATVEQYDTTGVHRTGKGSRARIRQAVAAYRAATSEPPTFCCGGDSKACMEHGPCSIEREARTATSERYIKADICHGDDLDTASSDLPCEGCPDPGLPCLGCPATSEQDGNCPPNCNGEACHMTPPCKQEASPCDTCGGSGWIERSYIEYGSDAPCHDCNDPAAPCEHANGHTSTTQQTHEETA